MVFVSACMNRLLCPQEQMYLIGDFRVDGGTHSTEIKMLAGVKLKHMDEVKFC